MQKKAIKWYAINIYSGYEKYAQYTLIEKIKKKKIRAIF